MLAPQQTIMRASANLRYESATASLPILNYLDFEHLIYQAVNAIANSPQKARNLSWNYDNISARGRR